MEVKWGKRFLLGRGSYGEVFLASPMPSATGYSDSLSLIAAKGTADMRLWPLLFEEGRFLHELNGCPEIVTCFGDDISAEDGKYVYNLLLEYAPGGTLAHKIKESCCGRLPEHEVCWYTYMLLKGISHIHREGIVHCDIKPANILVFPSKEYGGVNHVKIADFGLAKKSGSTDEITADGEKWNRNRGTPLYSSPESVLIGQHDAATDIWSLGITVMEMLTGKVGYGTGSSLGDIDIHDLLIQIAFEEEFPRIPENVSDEAKDFLIRCIERDPKYRWSADRLLEHPFIVENLIFAFGVRRAKVVWWNPVNNSSRWRCGEHLFSKQILAPAAPRRPAIGETKRVAAEKKGRPTACACFLESMGGSSWKQQQC